MDHITDRRIGILLGLAAGDALGTTLEFQPRRLLSNLHTEMIGEGVFGLAPGQWTDDTAMAVGMGRSLAAKAAFEPLDILAEWSAWYRDGKHSCTGTCFDIGAATAKALKAFLLDPTQPPVIAISALGNGSLMRLAPMVLFASSSDEAERLSYKQASLTHGEGAALATGWFGRILFETALTRQLNPAAFSPDIRQRRRDQVKSSGFYQDRLDAALWAVTRTNSFEDAVVQAVNLGDDADTVGAVAGQLAGAIYGFSSIPERWMKRLAWKDEMVQLARALVDLNPT